MEFTNNKTIGTMRADGFRRNVNYNVNMDRSPNNLPNRLNSQQPRPPNNLPNRLNSQQHGFMNSQMSTQYSSWQAPSFQESPSQRQSFQASFSQPQSFQTSPSQPQSFQASPSQPQSFKATGNFPGFLNIPPRPSNINNHVNRQQENIVNDLRFNVSNPPRSNNIPYNINPMNRQADNVNDFHRPSNYSSKTDPNLANQNWNKCPLFPQPVFRPLVNEISKSCLQPDKLLMQGDFQDKFVQPTNQFNPINPPQANIDLNSTSTFLERKLPMPPSFCIPNYEQSTTQSKEKLENEAKWLNSWIKTLDKKHQTPKKSCLTLPQMKYLLQESLRLMDELQLKKKVLNSDIKEESIWQFEYRCVLKIQKQLDSIKLVLADKELLKHLAAKLRKRKKKRECQKRQRLALKEEKLLAFQERAKKKDEINNWLHKLLETNQAAIREKQLVTEVDETLCEVRKKNSEALKVLELLKGLKKLRQLRTESAARQGLYTTNQANVNFEKSVSKLETLMKQQKTVYESEKLTMEVMLETEQEEYLLKEEEKLHRKQNETIKQFQSNIKKCLFGEEEMVSEYHLLYPFKQFYLQAELFPDNFLRIRKEWDIYLVKPDTPGSSKIPCGWITPSGPSSDVWATALKKT